MGWICFLLNKPSAIFLVSLSRACLLVVFGTRSRVFISGQIILLNNLPPCLLISATTVELFETFRTCL